VGFRIVARDGVKVKVCDPAPTRMTRATITGIETAGIEIE
jgi:hypothetical protein